MAISGFARIAFRRCENKTVSKIIDGSLCRSTAHNARDVWCVRLPRTCFKIDVSRPWRKHARHHFHKAVPAPTTLARCQPPLVPSAASAVPPWKPPTETPGTTRKKGDSHGPQRRVSAPILWMKQKLAVVCLIPRPGRSAARPLAHLCVFLRGPAVGNCFCTGPDLHSVRPRGT